MSDIKFIRNNKCVIGETYYLDGGWYDYNFQFDPSQAPYVTSKDNAALINTPVKFVGKKSKSNRGKHCFEFVNEPGRFIYDYATAQMLLEPIHDPEILREPKKQ